MPPGGCDDLEGTMDYPHMPVIRPTPFRTMFFGGPDRPLIDMEVESVTCGEMADQWHVEVKFTLWYGEESVDGRVIWSPVKSMSDCATKAPYAAVFLPDVRALPACLESPVSDAARRVVVGLQLTPGPVFIARQVSLVAAKDGDAYRCDHDTWDDVAAE